MTFPQIKSNPRRPPCAGGVRTTSAATLNFTPHLTWSVLSRCRAMGVTFSDALLVLAQVAFSRVLHKKREGLGLSDERWARDYLAQPQHFLSTLDIKPFLKAGRDNRSQASGLYTFTLAPMPRSSSNWNARGPPSFDNLLSQRIFLHRALQIKEQVSP
jgi:hypothetical protein